MLSDQGLATKFLEQLAREEGLDSELEAGLLNRLALSSFPFNAVTQLDDSYPLLNSRLKLYAPSVGAVRLVLTAASEFYAKMNVAGPAARCCVSLGIVVVAHCAALILVCRHSHLVCKREKLEELVTLPIRANDTVRAFRDQFRSPDAIPFVEESPVLLALGITVSEVDGLLHSASHEDFILASILANECIRFLILHELAHFDYGHAQLYRMWIDSPEIAEQQLDGGFPSDDARRAMESAADVWAVEKQIVAAMFRDTTIYPDALFGAAARPLQKLRFTITGIEFAFCLMGAVNSVLSGESELFTELRETLNGRVDRMYPGVLSRRAYAIPEAVGRVQRNYPYMRWTRWRSIRKDLKGFDPDPLGLWVSGAWNQARLFGNLLSPPNQPLRRPEKEQQHFELAGDGREHVVIPSSRFQYLEHHSGISGDLARAKTWWNRRAVAARRAG